MKNTVKLILIMIIGASGCSREGAQSLSKLMHHIDISVGSTFIPPDFFDPVSVSVGTQGTNYNYAKPVCASDCNISLPNGSSFNLNDFSNYFNTFDGNLRITGLDYKANPIYLDQIPYEEINFTPADPGGRNPAFENISESQSKMFSAASYLDGKGAGKAPPQTSGTSDFPTVDIAPDNVVESSVQQGKVDQVSKSDAEAKDQAQFDRIIGQMKADIEAPFASARAGAIASFAPTEKAFFKRVDEIAKSSIDKSETLANAARQQISNADFSNSTSIGDAAVQKSRTESAEIGQKILQSLPPVQISTKKSQFKTSPLSLDGKAVQRADEYLAYAEKTVQGAPEGEGKKVASSLLTDSKESLAIADDFFAKGESEWGDQALSVTYALLDAAVVLAPIAALAVAPAAVTVVVGLEAINIAKSWYEYKTGKHLFTGEKLSEAGRTFSLVNVVFGFIPPVAVAAGRIAGLFKKSSSVVTVALDAPPPARQTLDETVEDLSKIGANTTQEAKEFLEVMAKHNIKNVEWPEKISFNANLKKHMSSLERFTQEDGVTGAHNLANFEAVVSEKGIKIVNTVQKSKGIKTVEYQIPKLDRTQKPIPGEYKNKIFPKTVYDSSIISDSEMLYLAQIAAGQVSDFNPIGRHIYDAVAGGIRFRIYVQDGFVTNVHPW